MQPQPIQPQQTQPQQAQLRRPVWFRIIACVLILALFTSASVKLLPGLFSGTDGGSGRVQETATTKVTVDTPSVTLAGVTVDVNSLNLTDGEKSLTVKRREMSEYEDSGLKSVEYDISLGNTHRLRAPLTLTVPYDEKDADGGDVVLVHYDSDYGIWIPLDTTDNGDGTVTASLNSLSPVRAVFLGKDYSKALFYVSDKNTANAQMKVNMRWWELIKKQPLDTAAAVANGFLANGNTDASTSWINDAANDVNTMNTYYTLFGAAGDAAVSIAGEIAGAASATGVAASNLSKGIGAVSLIIAGVQLAYDSANPDAAPNTAAINLMKNICTNGGTLFGLATGGGTAAMSIAFFGVAMFGYGLDVAVAYAQDIQEDTVKAVCNYYYENLDSFNEKDWYDIFVDAYLDAWQNGKGSDEGAQIAIETVKDAIDNYAKKFWNDVYKDGNDTLTFAVAEAGRTNYFTPTAAQKQALILGIKKDMYERFEYNVLPWIRSYMKNEMQTALYCSLLDICAPFNEKYTIQIQESPPQEGTEFCKYYNHTVRIGFKNSFAEVDIPGTWSMKSPDDENEWAVDSEFTLISYILAGMPDTVLLFSPSNKSVDPTKCDKSVGFTLKPKGGDNTTLIELYEGDVGLSDLRYISYDVPNESFLVFISGDVADVIGYSLADREKIDIYCGTDGSMTFTVPAWTRTYTQPESDYNERQESEFSFPGVTFTGKLNPETDLYELTGSCGETTVITTSSHYNTKKIYTDTTLTATFDLFTVGNKGQAKSATIKMYYSTTCYSHVKEYSDGKCVRDAEETKRIEDGYNFFSVNLIYGE